MNPDPPPTPPDFDILMVDDNPGDARLMKEALKEARLNHRFHWVDDGEAALDFLHRRTPHLESPRPHLILLDLNLPRKDGREVLAHLKANPGLQAIPVVILTTSLAQEDIAHAYRNHANCYINKPVTLDQFIDVVISLKHYWFDLASLPVP